MKVLDTDKHYYHENIEGIENYFYKGTRRIVALKPSDYTIAVCVNTYNKNKKQREGLYNEYNPSFIVFATSCKKEILERDIYALVDLLKLGGNLSIFSVGKNKTLTVGQFTYDRELKCVDQPLYDREFGRHNIKAAGKIMGVMKNGENYVNVDIKNWNLSEPYDTVYSSSEHQKVKEYILSGLQK